MIAYLNNEPGADVVEAALIDPANFCYAHASNLLRGFLYLAPSGGETAADNAIADLAKIGVNARDDFDEMFGKMPAD
ncbi:MAG: hypothetical protein WKF84_11715 [Pyrinomonadaceae bacterium]